jgi:3-oxoacyl-[acyl-carrier protein] reductase
MKIAVVTGASRGIGRAVAVRLADEGYKVVINYNKSEKEAREVLNLIEGKGMCLKCDVSDYNSVQEMFATIKESLGSVDVLVNNAGIIRDRTISKMTKDEWQEVVGVNLNGVFNCTKNALEIMNENGRIVNVASVIGVSGAFGQSNYAAAKAGVIGFTKSIAQETEKRSITCNAIIPGLVLTDMTKKLIDDGYFSGVEVKKPEDVALRVLEVINSEKNGEVVDV